MSDGSNAFEQLVIESLKEMKKGIAAVGDLAQQTYQQAARTNGTVADLTRWRAEIEDWRRELEYDGATAHAFAAGRQAQQSAYINGVKRAGAIVASPLLKALAVVSLVTVGFTLGQIREVWPW